MSCRQCEGIERFFDGSEAKRELRRYRRKGPTVTTRLLVNAIREQGVEGATVLDIGGGVGAIQHELLKAGAATTVSVDASPAYARAAAEEGTRLGHSDRMRAVNGDFVEIAETIEAADIVTLDRVICCYHDVRGLVGLSAERAGRLYGLVFPRDNLFLKLGFRLLNLAMWATRNPFRTFVHPNAVVESLVDAKGLRRVYYRKTLFWQVALYTR